MKRRRKARRRKSLQQTTTVCYSVRHSPALAVLTLIALQSVHVCDVTGQPGLQSEKTSLHEKSKKKSKETLLSHAPDGFMLPHVRGAEGEELTAPVRVIALKLLLRFMFPRVSSQSKQALTQNDEEISAATNHNARSVRVRIPSKSQLVHVHVHV